MNQVNKYKNYFNCIDITNVWLGTNRKKINAVIKHKNGDLFKYKGR